MSTLRFIMEVIRTGVPVAILTIQVAMFIQ
jgi:hypothetical protein